MMIDRSFDAGRPGGAGLPAGLEGTPVPAAATMPGHGSGRMSLTILDAASQGSSTLGSNAPRKSRTGSVLSKRARARARLHPRRVRSFMKARRDYQIPPARQSASRTIQLHAPLSKSHAPEQQSLSKLHASPEPVHSSP